jgi:hypothetical protein
VTDIATHPSVLAWVDRVAPGAGVIGSSTRTLPGGTVAARVERITLHLADGATAVDLVRKDASAAEIAGLRAAQVVRPQVDAVPELVASGTDWLVTPMIAGTPLASGNAGVPEMLFDALGRLHAHYRGGAGVPEALPRVTGEWWSGLCLGWVDPQLRAYADRHPGPVAERARDLVGRAARQPAALAALDRLTPTLLHGDVHPGNVLVDGDRATLIDWGSSRVGPAMLDLANLVDADSPEVARYAAVWRQLTGEALPADAVALGYRWAALQIPVQYLPWTMGNQPTDAVETALDLIDGALRQFA